MSDIGGVPGRAANGGARAQGPIPVQATPVTASRSTVITPTEIMRRREERAKREQERTQAANEEQRRRLEGEWAAYDEATAAGVAAPIPSQTQPASQPTSVMHRRVQSATNPPTSRAPGAQPTSATYPPLGSTPQSVDYQPGGAVQAPANPTSTTPPAGIQNTAQQRTRASTTRQPRPVQATAGPSYTQRPSQSAAQRPQDTSDLRAERERMGRQPGVPSSVSETATRRGDGTISSFPHAFERWEILSSKWEGMTSYWINRLQMNSEELQNQPMLAQLSRQVTDLSAAGANLFTALVEIQKLRASSERKFQRWFNDTKHEMERQQETIGQLERAVIQERRDRAEDQALWEKRVESAQRTEINSGRLNAEKDRELQIAKDESRRAWEELGRYEALERERQKALAQGLQVEIGGYTVFPTRPGSASHRAEYPDDPRPTSRRGPQPVVQDDPFVADVSAAEALYTRSEGEPISPPGATAGATAPRGRVQPSHSASYSQPGEYSYSHPEHSSAAGYTSFSSPPAAPTGNFYHQTNAPIGYDPDEEGYELDDDGEPLTDSQGRPISYRRGLHEARSSESEGDNGHFTSFGRDPADHRQRVPATSAQAMAAAHPIAGAGGAIHPQSMQTRPESDLELFHNYDEDDVENRYTGAGYGGLSPHEEGPHYRPTRLSDVPEEDEASRASEAGGVSRPF